MTASVVKSTIVTNLQASGAGNPIGGDGVDGLLRSKAVTIATVATTSIDETGDIVHLLPLRSNAVIRDLRFYADDMDSHSTPTLAYDVGLYHCTGTGTADGTVIDADCFASAITTGQSASVIGADILFESASTDIININKRLWEIGGLSADPGGWFMLSMTITTTAATPVAGSVSLRADYILG